MKHSDHGVPDSGRAAVRTCVLLFASYVLFGIRVGDLRGGADQGAAGGGSEPERGAERELGFEEQVRALSMLAAQIRGNFERIETWRTSYRFCDAFHFPGNVPPASASDRADSSARLAADDEFDRLALPVGPQAGTGYWEITRGRIDCIADFRRQAYRIFYQPDKPVAFVDIPTGKRYEWATFGDQWHWIVTPEHSLEFEPKHHHGQLDAFPPVPWVPPTGGRIAYRLESKGVSRKTRFVNPRDFFSNGTWLYHELLEFLVRALSDKGPDEARRPPHGGLRISVTGENEVPQYRVTRHYIRGEESVTLFDGHVGFNATLYRFKTATGAVMSELSTSYTERAGIYIPERVTDSSASMDGTLSFRRSFIMESASLNVPVSEADFETGQFGLKYGERMLDKLNDRLLIYDDEQGFLPADQFVLDRSRLPPEHPESTANAVSFSAKPNPQRLRPALFIINGMVLAFVVAFIVYLRFRSHR